MALPQTTCGAMFAITAAAASLAGEQQNATATGTAKYRAELLRFQQLPCLLATPPPSPDNNIDQMFPTSRPPRLLQYGELPEQAAYGEEFMKAMSFFTRHSLAGGATSLKVSRLRLRRRAQQPIAYCNTTYIQYICITGGQLLWLSTDLQLVLMLLQAFSAEL